MNVERTTRNERAARRFATAFQKRKYARTYRAKRRDANKCINGPLDGVIGRRAQIEHGAVVSGGKCQRCLDVHARSA